MSDNGVLSESYTTFNGDYYEMSLRSWIADPWISKKPLYVGQNPRDVGAPSAYCTVERNGEDLFIVYVYWDGGFHGCEAIFWYSWLVVGCGEQVHFISLDSLEVDSCGVFYYYHLYAAEDYLLVGTMSSIICYNKDRQRVWCTDDLALDEVKITSVKQNCVLGMGWQVHGWVPFTLSLLTGEQL